MWSECRTRAFVAVVIAVVCAAATGCINPSLNPFPAYPPYPGYGYGYPPPQPPNSPQPTPPAPTPDKSATPPVDNRTAESLTRAQYQPPSTPLPVPQPVPSGAQPVPPAQPQVVPPPRTLGGSPNERTTPTVTGEKFALGPNELPIDRALELQRRVDELAEANKQLQARIVRLEANGLSREQALNEALREVERATEMVTKARADVQALRNELIALRERVKKSEDRELETLNKVIQALQQLLDDK